MLKMLQSQRSTPTAGMMLATTSMAAEALRDLCNPEKVQFFTSGFYKRGAKVFLKPCGADNDLH